MQLLEILAENDEAQLAAQLKQALDTETEDGKLDEIAITAVGFLSWALASNTIIDLLGKYSDKADAIHQWAHNNEQNFVRLIGGVISPFIKDKSKRDMVAKGLFIAILAGLGVKAGIGAIKAIKGLNATSAVLSGVKGALKGRDIANVGAEILAAI